MMVGSEGSTTSVEHAVCGSSVNPLSDDAAAGTLPAPCSVPCSAIAEQHCDPSDVFAVLRMYRQHLQDQMEALSKLQADLINGATAHEKALQDAVTNRTSQDVGEAPWSRVATTAPNRPSCETEEQRVLRCERIATTYSFSSKPSVAQGRGNSSNSLACAQGWVTPTTMSYSAMRGTTLRRLVDSNEFNCVSFLLITVNCALAGLEVDFNARGEHEVAEMFDIPQRICTLLFVIEVLMRTWAAGRRFFKESGLVAALDITIVACAILEFFVTEVLCDSPHCEGDKISMLRVFRVLRFTRVVRVIRMTRFFRELRLMIASIYSSCKSLAWALMLLGVLMYMFGVIFTQGVSEHLRLAPNQNNNAELIKHYGTIPRSVFSLFVVCFNGLDWVELFEPLEPVGWFYELLFLLFVSFTLLALLNIVTGVFVEQAMQTAHGDADVMIQEELAQESSVAKQLRGVFAEADVEGTGVLTLQAFEEYLKDTRVRYYLRALGLEVTEAWGLFRLLDIQDTGTVNMDEFTMGCLRLKGDAKSIDIASLMYENKRTMRALSNEIGEISERVSSLEPMISATLLQFRQVHGRLSDPTEAQTQICL